MITGGRTTSSVVVALLTVVCGVEAQAASGGPRPDLVVAKLSSPPGAVAPGESFAVTDRIANRGDATAPKTSARFYLSADDKHQKSDLQLTGVEPVKALKAGKSFNGDAHLQVPSDTPAGVYAMLGCADGAAKAKEESERNNCRASQTPLAVQATSGVPPGENPPPPPPPPPPPGDADSDGDGSPDSADCDDLNPAIHPGAADDPDLAFIDSNCDGIDGTESAAIFVSPSGSDLNPGTKTQPKQTLAQAIATAAGAVPVKNVYAATGPYSERLTVADGVGVFGGYNPTSWARAAFPATAITVGATGGNVQAAVATNIAAPTELQLISLNAPDAVAAGASTYGLRADNAGALVLSAVMIAAGHGAAGTDGTPGEDGAAGNPGAPGNPGSCDGSRGTGGGGGSSSIGRAGGKGGDGGAEGVHSGQDGGEGQIGTLGGPGGPAGDNGAFGTGVAGGPGVDGHSGAGGADGGNGSGGGAGAVAGGLWVTDAGGAGTTGDPGNGGGGGGGGGGQGGALVDDGGGNGGGGGGAGGEPGTGGGGGHGGGGSFGVFLVNSTGITISNSTIGSGHGGAGGAGAAGGAGGDGGTGALGASTCIGEVGAGGKGGDGGDGGDGGAGGGGAGGPSYAIFKSSTTPTVTATTLTHGLGGAGGLSSGNSGTAGASGDQS
jgi:CARDB/Putative metal-binding motif